MVFNATFDTVSVILWWSVLLLEKTGVPGENHRPVASHWQTSSHNVVSSTPRVKKWIWYKLQDILKSHYFSQLYVQCVVMLIHSQIPHCPIDTPQNPWNRKKTLDSLQTLRNGHPVVVPNQTLNSRFRVPRASKSTCIRSLWEIDD